MRTESIDNILAEINNKSTPHKPDKNWTMINRLDDRVEYLNWKGHHREDGPAIIWTSGTKQWLINGQHHRLDGPAVEYNDERVDEWWIDGIQYGELEFKILRRSKVIKKILGSKDNSTYI